MAVSRSVDKRRELIRRQLYGKEVFTPKQGSTSPSRVFEYHPENESTTNTVDVSYLKRDLLKILFLTFAAIVFQILLFIASQNGLIHLRLP